MSSDTSLPKPNLSYPPPSIVKECPRKLLENPPKAITFDLQISQNPPNLPTTCSPQKRIHFDLMILISLEKLV